MKNAMQLKAIIKNLAKEKHISAQLVMQNFMLERLLERISISRYQQNFILKGGFLIAAMVGLDTRATMDMDATIKGLLDKYNATHEEQLSRITPHVLRHTFCTRMAERGMNPKTMQYLMGHADITVTLNVYTHASYTKVADEMAQITAV